MMLVSFFVIIYYNVIIACAFHYLFASFTSVLPWTLCNEWWTKAAQCPQVCYSYMFFTVRCSVVCIKIGFQIFILEKFCSSVRQNIGVR